MKIYLLKLLKAYLIKNKQQKYIFIIFKLYSEHD